MKFYITFILSAILSIISLYFVADYHEHGDINAVSMYMIVWTLPLIILSLINGIVLKVLEKKAKGLRIFISLLIPAISIILLFTDDASLNFVGMICLISFGITNAFWLGFNLDQKQ